MPTVNHYVKELIRSAAFLLVLGALCLALSVKTKDMYITGGRAQFEKNMETRKDWRFVSLGNSHAAYGVKPGYMKLKGFSAAVDGEDLFETIAKARAIHAAYPEMDTMLISISYFSFLYDNGNYTGEGDRTGTRVTLYASYPVAAPVSDDLSSFIKGRGFSLITRDHLQRVVFRALDLEQKQLAAQETKPLATKTGPTVIFDGDERRIPNQMYRRVGRDVVLVGYEVDKTDAFDCGKFTITWYWYCEQNPGTLLQLRATARGEKDPPTELPLFQRVKNQILKDGMPGSIVFFTQDVVIPEGWQSRSLSVEIEDKDGVTKGSTGASDGSWPRVSIVSTGYRNRAVTKLNSARKKLHQSACQRAEDYWPIVANMHQNRPDVTRDSTLELASLVREMKAAGVRVILYTAPFYRAYNERFYAPWRQLMRRQVKKIVRETGVEYHDFSANAGFQDQDKLFKNSDHLNAKGAKLFSRKMERIMTSRQ